MNQRKGRASARWGHATSPLALALATSCGGIADLGNTRPTHDEGALDAGTGGQPQATGGAASEAGGRSSSPGGTSPVGVSSGGAEGSVSGDAGASDGEASTSEAGTDAPLDASDWPDRAATFAGHYDVWMGAPERGCTFASRQSRLNLSIGGTDVPELLLFADYEWWWPRTITSFREETLHAVPLPHPERETRPELWLDTDTSGLVGTGRALSLVECPDGTTESQEVSLRVVPDMTPPVVGVAPATSWGHVFPFTWFWISISEPPDTLAQPWRYPAFYDAASVEGRFGWLDAETGAAVATELHDGPGGLGALLSLGDQDTLAGRTVRIGILEPLRDSAGNAAVADNQHFTVENADPVLGRWDFDDGPHAGAKGNTTYVPSGIPGSPCESGGCLVLEGELPECRADDSNPGILGVRLDVPAGHRISLRFRLWASTEASVELQLEEPDACSQSFRQRVTALPAPDGAYSHATDWQTIEGSTCSGSSPDRGLIVSPGCQIGGSSPVRTRVVVEWIEVTRVSDAG